MTARRPITEHQPSSRFRKIVAGTSRFLFLVGAVWAATPANAAFVTIDDFQSYPTGSANAGGSTAFTASGGPWQPRDSSGNIAVSSIVTIQATGANKYLRFADDDSVNARSAYRAVTPIAEGARGIYYFQVYTGDSTPYASYGLSDLTTATSTDSGFGDFEAYVTLRDLDGAGTPGFNLVGRGGGSDVTLTLASGLTTSTWYDIWLDIDNATDTYDVYFGTTGNPDVLGTKVGFGLGFRNGTAANKLVTFMTLDDAGSVSGKATTYLDNIRFSAVEVPEPSTFVLAALGLLGLMGIRRRSRNR